MISARAITCPPIDLPAVINQFQKIRKNILNRNRPDQPHSYSPDLQGLLTNLVMAAGLPVAIQDDLLQPDNRYVVTATDSGIRSSYTDCDRGQTVYFRIDSNPGENTLSIHVVRHDLNNRGSAFPGACDNFRIETNVTFSGAGTTYSRLAETHGTIRPLQAAKDS